jgi:hypothetical protein
MFTARWRWNASVALAIPRFRGGTKVAPQLQRMYAEDLVADIFPAQIACAENIAGDREIPDHPLIAQTIRDCLEEAMDIEGLERLLTGIERGSIAIVARDVTEPSPLAQQILAARPYAYLDDAPLEERRTQAVMSRRWLDPESASDLGKLDVKAIERVRDEAFPEAETAGRAARRADVVRLPERGGSRRSRLVGRPHNRARRRAARRARAYPGRNAMGGCRAVAAADGDIPRGIHRASDRDPEPYAREEVRARARSPKLSGAAWKRSAR